MASNYVKYLKKKKTKIDKKALQGFINMVIFDTKTKSSSELVEAQTDKEFLESFKISDQADTSAFDDTERFINEYEYTKKRPLSKIEYLESIERLKKYSLTEVDIETFMPIGLRELLILTFSNYYHHELIILIKGFIDYIKGLEAIRILNNQLEIKCRYHFKNKWVVEKPYIEYDKMLDHINPTIKKHFDLDLQREYHCYRGFKYYYCEISYQSGITILWNITKKKHNCYLFKEKSEYQTYISLLDYSEFGTQWVNGESIQTHYSNNENSIIEIDE
jgi:hypothetical protein